MVGTRPSQKNSRETPAGAWPTVPSHTPGPSEDFFANQQTRESTTLIPTLSTETGSHRPAITTGPCTVSPLPYDLPEIVEWRGKDSAQLAPPPPPPSLLIEATATLVQDDPKNSMQEVIATAPPDVEMAYEPSQSLRALVDATNQAATQLLSSEAKASRSAIKGDAELRVSLLTELAENLSTLASIVKSTLSYIEDRNYVLGALADLARSTIAIREEIFTAFKLDINGVAEVLKNPFLAGNALRLLSNLATDRGHLRADIAKNVSIEAVSQAISSQQTENFALFLWGTVCEDSPEAAKALYNHLGNTFVPIATAAWNPATSHFALRLLAKLAAKSPELQKAVGAAIAPNWRNLERRLRTQETQEVALGLLLLTFREADLPVQEVFEVAFHNDLDLIIQALHQPDFALNALGFLLECSCHSIISIQTVIDTLKRLPKSCYFPKAPMKLLLAAIKDPETGNFALRLTMGLNLSDEAWTLLADALQAGLLDDCLTNNSVDPAMLIDFIQALKDMKTQSYSTPSLHLDLVVRYHISHVLKLLLTHPNKVTWLVKFISGGQTKNSDFHNVCLEELCRETDKICSMDLSWAVRTALGVPFKDFCDLVLLTLFNDRYFRFAKDSENSRLCSLLEGMLYLDEHIENALQTRNSNAILLFGHVLKKHAPDSKLNLAIAANFNKSMYSMLADDCRKGKPIKEYAGILLFLTRLRDKLSKDDQSDLEILILANIPTIVKEASSYRESIFADLCREIYSMKSVRDILWGHLVITDKTRIVRVHCVIS